MSDLLEGRVAIVTGGARGVGLAIAQTMALHGAHVIIVDNGCAIDGEAEDPGVCEAAAERCHGLALARSVTDAGVVQEALDLAVRNFGALDIVAHCATSAAFGRVGAVSIAQFERVLATRLTAAWSLTAAALAQMQSPAQKSRLPGRIINVLSAAGLYGAAGQGAEAAANAGLLGLTRSVAMEVASSGITCNAVIPFAGTRTVAEQKAESPAQLRYKQTTMKIPPSFAGNFVTWLASSEAASVNGQTFGVRGRELFVFDQPQPQDAVFASSGVMDSDEMSELVLNRLALGFAPLASDAELFGSEPIL